MALARTTSTLATLSGGPKHICVETTTPAAYVTSGVTGRLSQLNLTTNVFINNFFGNGTVGSVSGTQAVAQLNTPTFPCTDGSYVYFVENPSFKIRRGKISDRSLEDFVGSGVTGTADGTGAAASFPSISGMVMNNGATKKLYVSHGTALRVIDVATQAVSTMPAVTQAGCALGITADDKYLIGSYSSRIWVLELANPGFIIYIAGNGVTTADLDGLSRSSQFRDVSQLAASAGLIFIAELTGKSLRQLTFDPQTLVPNMTNVAGDGQALSVDGTATGTGTGTSINGCGGVAVWPGQPTLTLLFTDTNGSKVGKVV